METPRGVGDPREAGAVNLYRITSERLETIEVIDRDEFDEDDY
jgi:hypothetical protein